MTLRAEDIAHVCHEANRALQRIEEAQGGVHIPIAPRWDRLDQHTRDSAITGVKNILDGVVTTPEQSHESWCEFKRAAGWTHGERKDEVAKTHPCLVPYAQLPDEWKIKDTLFFAIVNALRPRQTAQGAFDQGRSEGRAG